MDEPIESAYFNWLCNKIQRVEVPTPSLTHWKLLRKLHDTEFVWLITGDDNRVEDGLDLRHEFLRHRFVKPDHIWEFLGCSVLEMLIAFTTRTSFQTDDPPETWFWIFMENLGLSEFNDAYDVSPEIIDDILYRFIWRTYDYSGRGGLFPMRNPQHDQRKVEIWYQFCEYLVDQET